MIPKNDDYVALYRKYEGQETIFLGIVKRRFYRDLLADLGASQKPYPDYWIEESVSGEEGGFITAGLEKLVKNE